MPEFDQTPDFPGEFGFKISWFAVKASDPVSVLEALAFGHPTPANWASGLAAAYGRSQDSEASVFVSPPISGWVLGSGLIKSTIQGWQPGRQRPGNFAPAGRIGLRCA
jgi:hypothetical protein